MHGGPIGMAEKWIELAKREVSMGKKLAILLIPAVALTVTLAGGFASAAVQAAVSQKGNENRKTGIRAHRGGRLFGSGFQRCVDVDKRFQPGPDPESGRSDSCGIAGLCGQAARDRHIPAGIR